MTLDTLHLRQLLANATPAPLEFENGAIFREDNWCIMSTLDPGALPTDDAAAYVALRNNAGELLDRSDAFTEALRLLRAMSRYAFRDPECPSDITGDATDLLARYPQEAKQ